MEFDNFNQFSDAEFDETLSFKNLVERYLIYAKWFVVCILLLIILAFLKIRSEAPAYAVSSSILIHLQV